MVDSEDSNCGRRLKRHEVPPLAVEVYDAVNQVLIGRVVNVHEEGLMIVCEHQLTGNSLYQFELKLPVSIEDQNKIAIGVDCLWSRSNGEGTMNWAGCKIIDISEPALLTLKKLISQLEK